MPTVVSILKAVVADANVLINQSKSRAICGQDGAESRAAVVETEGEGVDKSGSGSTQRERKLSCQSKDESVCEQAEDVG
jgi:hypothetical protein